MLVTLCTVLLLGPVASPSWVVRQDAIVLDAVFAPVPRLSDAVVGLELAPSRLIDEDTHSALEKGILQAVLRQPSVREARVVVGRKTDELDYVLTARLVASSNGLDVPVLLVELLEFDGDRVGAGSIVDVFGALAARASRPAELTDETEISDDTAARTQQFYSRAWRLGTAQSFNFLRGNRTELVARRADGGLVSDDDLAKATTNPELLSALTRARRGRVLTLGYWGAALLTPVLTLPLILTMGGMLVAAAGATMPAGQEVKRDVLMGGALAALMLAMGMLAVAAVAAVAAGLIQMFLFSGLSYAEWAALVRTHNQAVAQELGAEPRSVAPEYLLQ